jgi:hypothetical protein
MFICLTVGLFRAVTRIIKSETTEAPNVKKKKKGPINKKLKNNVNKISGLNIFQGVSCRGNDICNLLVSPKANSRLLRISPKLIFQGHKLQRVFALFKFVFSYVSDGSYYTCPLFAWGVKRARCNLRYRYS